MDLASTAVAGDSGPDVLSDEWCAEHFDHLAPELSDHFDDTLDRLRSQCPVAHSDRYGGFWVVSRYQDVLRVLQTWETFINGLGVSIPMRRSEPPLPPDEFDPPLHRFYKRLITSHLTPSIVAGYEASTRRLIANLIDAFVEDGRCEFMAAYALQFPRLSFFECVFHAPPDELEQLNEWTKLVTTQRDHPDYHATNTKLLEWIDAFAARRRAQSSRGDIVDAVVNAEIDGRPITHDEVLGILQQLMFGGFDTTTAALGSAVLRFARTPGLQSVLARQEELIPTAVEEFLRLDPPVVCMARSVTRDVEIGGKQFGAGDKVLFSVSSANRDAAEFAEPAVFDLDRDINRHVTFGAGLHRCAGSNLARMNLRWSLEAIVTRLAGTMLQDGAEPIRFHTSFTRTPVALPITFAPGARS